MTDSEIIWTCIGFGALTLIVCIVMAIGLCRAAGRKAPHSCHMGLDDDQIKEMQKEDE